MTGPVLKAEEDVRRHICFKRDMRELPGAVAQRMLDALDGGAEPDYAALKQAATFLEPPQLVYHTAPATERARILEGGLAVSQPGQGGAWEPHLAPFLRTQPPGVYVTAEPDIRGVFAHWPAWDVWEVRRLDLPWQHDTLNPGCWSLSTDVPAGQLRLYATYGSVDEELQ